jgi:exodeoxyribonuclease-3
MKVLTWNVNSIRQRLPRLLAVLSRHDPDVVCLQETKVPDEDFPFDEVQEAGFHAVSFGQRAYNGVAVLAKEPVEIVSRGMADDPAGDATRLLFVRTGALSIASVYAVNGKAVGDPAYETKLAWFDALSAWAQATIDPTQPALLAGDFNVTPDDRDVHDPERWRGRNLASQPERDRLATLMKVGFSDLGREAAGDVTGPFTFWDYRMGAFHRGWGLRIDLLLGSEPLRARLLEVEVDREERKPTAGEGKPSDHAPVVVTFRDEA